MQFAPLTYINNILISVHLPDYSQLMKINFSLFTPIRYLSFTYEDIKQLWYFLAGTAKQQALDTKAIFMSRFLGKVQWLPCQNPLPTFAKPSGWLCQRANQRLNSWTKRNPAMVASRLYLCNYCLTKFEWKKHKWGIMQLFTTLPLDGLPFSSRH